MEPEGRRYFTYGPMELVPGPVWRPGFRRVEPTVGHCVSFMFLLRGQERTIGPLVNVDGGRWRLKFKPGPLGLAVGGVLCHML